MLFKDWFSLLSEDAIENSVFKCIGYCEKFFFYTDKDCTVNKLINDINNGWGPANFDIVYISDVFYQEDKIWFVLVCNDHKQGLTNEQIKKLF